MSERIHLSIPHMTGMELEYIREAFAANWIAPVGPHIDAFEREFAELVGVKAATAVVSGTAAIHLALRVAGVGRGDEVWVSTLTFAASVNPVLYQGGTPVFVDSEEHSWNMDADLFVRKLKKRAKMGRLPKAVVLVHLYGQSADIDPILEACERYGIVLVEDAAEALGATYKGKVPGTLGTFGIYSFNGNKLVTTGGGGMLVSDDEALIARAKKLATQAREPVVHYEHTEIGYNYRMSNVLAGIGRAQLKVLEERVAARRRNFDYYKRALGNLPGVRFMPEAPWGRHTRWLTTLTIDPDQFGADREEVRLALEAANIESRPVWKPMHLQPVYKQYEAIGGEVARELYRDGLCLPSGSQLTEPELERIVKVIRSSFRG